MTDGAHSGLVERNTFYIAVALLAVLLIAASAFLWVRIAKVGAQVDSLNAPDTAALAGRMAALEAKVAALDQKVNPAIKMAMLYDSSDNFSFPAMASQQEIRNALKPQNIAVEFKDVAGRQDQYRKAGFNAYPVMFIPQDAIDSHPQLAAIAPTLPPATLDGVDGRRFEAMGFVTNAKTLLETSCTQSNGRVSLYEFGSLDCFQCGRAYADAKTVGGELNNSVDFAFRHYPREGSNFSYIAAEAAECAREQGKFDQFVSEVYSRQNASDAQNSFSPEMLNTSAKFVGLDLGSFNACISSGSKQARVNADSTEAVVSYYLRVQPAFVVDCKYAFTPASPAQLRQSICRARPDACGNSTKPPSPAIPIEVIKALTTSPNGSAGNSG